MSISEKLKNKQNKLVLLEHHNTPKDAFCAFRTNCVSFNGTIKKNFIRISAAVLQFLIYQFHSGKKNTNLYRKITSKNEMKNVQKKMLFGCKSFWKQTNKNCDVANCFFLAYQILQREKNAYIYKWETALISYIRIDSTLFFFLIHFLTPLTKEMP